MSAKNLLLGEVEDDSIYSTPTNKGYLTADEIEADKRGPNGEEGLSAKEPTETQYKNIAGSRPGAEELHYWKPLHTVSEEDAKRAGAAATKLARSVKEWLDKNPDAARAQETRTEEHPQVHNYSEIWDAYKQANASHEREKQDLEKKRRRDKVLAGLADGLGAFHEAYSYARGLEPMKGVGETGKKVADAYDKRRLLLDKDYKDRMDEILNHLKMERQMELDAETRWWREQDLKERQRWHDMNKQGKEDAATQKAETDAKKAEQKDRQLAQGDRRLDQKDQEIDIKRNNQGKSSSGKSGTKKGKQTKKKKKSSLYGGKKKLY